MNAIRTSERLKGLSPTAEKIASRAPRARKPSTRSLEHFTKHQTPITRPDHRPEKRKRANTARTLEQELPTTPRRVAEELEELAEQLANELDS